MEENWYDFVTAFGSLCHMWDYICLFIYLFIYPLIN